MPSPNRAIPGTTGYPFDVVLHAAEKIERIPSWAFAILLFPLAFLFARLHWLPAAILYAFFLLDWLLLLLLPRFQRSFGPAKPPLLALALLRSPFFLLPLPAAIAFQVLGTLLVVDGFWIEPQRLTLTHQTLVSPRLSPGAHLRLMHLGDLHMERITAREHRLQQWIDEFKPDVIVFTGDVLSLSYRHDPLAHEHARQVIRQWHAPLGVFFVSGSPAVDLPDIFPSLIQGLPITHLDNQTATLSFPGGALDLVGLTCTHQPALDLQTLKTIYPTRSDRVTILLYHSPDLAPSAAQMGIDLQLSGHTHGGQVCLPGWGALYTASLTGKQFESGRKRVGHMLEYTTRGLGMEGAGAPRVRFLCPPEVILWDIQGLPPAELV